MAITGDTDTPRQVKVVQAPSLFIEGEPSVTLFRLPCGDLSKEKNLIDLTSRLLCHDYPHFI